MGMGSNEGWVEDSAVVRMRTSEAGVASLDYHSDINAENFEDWLKRVLPNLPPHSVLVNIFVLYCEWHSHEPYSTCHS